MRKFVLLAILILLTPALLSADTIRFGVPPWPGVTVKTEIVSQVVNAMGYETDQKEVGPPIIYKTMTKDQMEVFLGAWTPHQNDMLNPLSEKGEIEKLGVNIEDCKIGLCVPEYVWDSGVKDMGDLDKNGAKFKNKIYNIEPGSGMHNEMSAIIKNDAAGLGNWEQIGSATSAMLSQVKSKMKNKEWVAFGCWSPHWMTIEMDMKFLGAVPGTEKFISTSKVYTVVNKNFNSRYPELYKFMKQLKVPTQIQSLWIYEYGYKEIEPEEVAENWISENHEMVSVWLKNVKAKNGKPAIEVIKKAFPEQN
ncbi:MAG: glycine betaine ABC transporter substrate-binding protein [Thermodesulfobacteriota bacterium]